MIAKWFRRLRRIPRGVNPAELAGVWFDRGENCTQSVLRGTIGMEDPAMLRMAKGFGGGIGDRKCLCGAVTGGVIALGLKGLEGLSGELVDAFRAEFRVTCCSGLTRQVEWGSEGHHANCRRITCWTAGKVAAMIDGED